MEVIKSLQNKFPCNNEIPIAELMRFILRHKMTIILFVVFVTAVAGLYETFRPQRYIARSYAVIPLHVILKQSVSTSPLTLPIVELITRSTSFHEELKKTLNKNKYHVNISQIFNIKHFPSNGRLLIQVESQERETAEKLLQIWLETFKRYMRGLYIDMTIEKIYEEIVDAELRLAELDMSLQFISAKKQRLDIENKTHEQYYLHALLSLELQQELAKEQNKKLIENKNLLIKTLNNFVQSPSNSVDFSAADEKTIDIARSIIEESLPVVFTEIELIQNPRRIILISLLAFILSSGGICIVMVGIFGLVSTKNERSIK